jgi:hypothetical protein
MSRLTFSTTNGIQSFTETTIMLPVLGLIDVVTFIDAANLGAQTMRSSDRRLQLHTSTG